jgi:hypothetical protein
MRDLQSVFEMEHGLVLPGWQLIEATDISADGRTIVGLAVDPAGRYVGWVAMVPEPAGAWTLGVFMLAALLRFVCRRKARLRVS